MDVFNPINMFPVSSSHPAVVLNNPSHSYSATLLLPLFQQWLNPYLVNFLIASNICPPITPLQINVIEGHTVLAFLGDEGIRNFVNGSYYRIPIDTSTTVNNEHPPKYLNSLPLPFTAFAYPSTNIHTGKALVKTLTSISFNQSDIETITQSQAQSDLQEIVMTIFAL